MSNNFIYLRDFYDDYVDEFDKKYYVLNFNTHIIKQKYGNVKELNIYGYFAIDKYRMKNHLFLQKLKLGYFKFEEKEYLYIDDKIFLCNEVKIIKTTYLFFIDIYTIKTPFKEYTFMLSIGSKQDILCSNIVENMVETIKCIK